VDRQGAVNAVSRCVAAVCVAIAQTFRGRRRRLLLTGKALERMRENTAAEEDVACDDNFGSRERLPEKQLTSLKGQGYGREQE
jgi:tRNA U54 and U55 pseudouridine synthase Pus10